MVVVDLLFNPMGRISRTAFFVGLILVTILEVVYLPFFRTFLDLVPAELTKNPYLPAIVIAQILVQVLLIWHVFVLTAKRLHDLDHSAIWVFPFFVIFGLITINTMISKFGFVFQDLEAIRNYSLNHEKGLIALAGLLASLGVIFVVYISGFRGNSGLNKFGPKPSW